MRLTIILALAFCTSLLYAQEKVVPYPHLSPLQKLEIPIGIVEFELEYSRPSMRGRNIFGNLEPYGDLWRTGANKNMKLSFNESIIINADTLSPGTYTIFTKPEADKWTIYFYDHIDWYGVPKGIDPLPVITQFEVQPIVLRDAIETLDISFTGLSYGGGNIEISWERTRVTFPFIIPYDNIITQRLADQRETLASDYAYSANIYLNKKKNPMKALQYLNLCTATRENGASFDQWLSNLENKDLGLPWAHFTKSKIYETRKEYQNAIEQAKLSMRIAKIVGSNYYKKENTANLEKWKSGKVEKWKEK